MTTATRPPAEARSAATAGASSATVADASGVVGSASCAVDDAGIDGSGVEGSVIGRWSVSGGDGSESEAYLMR